MIVAHGSNVIICGGLLYEPLPGLHKCVGYDPDPVPGDLCRKVVLLYSEVFPQISLVGLFSLRNSMNPHIRWEGIGNDLQYSPLVLRVHRVLFQPVPQFSSVFSLSEEPVCCVCYRD